MWRLDLKAYLYGNLCLQTVGVNADVAAVVVDDDADPALLHMSLMLELLLFQPTMVTNHLKLYTMNMIITQLFLYIAS